MHNAIVTQMLSHLMVVRQNTDTEQVLLFNFFSHHHQLQQRYMLTALNEYNRLKIITAHSNDF